MRLTLELERETDGRWIAEVVDLSGVMVYGETPEAAATAAKSLALRVLADRIEAGEIPAEALRSVDFVEHEPLAVD